MRIESTETPCIYRETKQCGKKIELFYFEVLPKKVKWEILVSRKMTEWKIEKKYHETILDFLEVILPILVIVIAGMLFGDWKNK